MSLSVTEEPVAEKPIVHRRHLRWGEHDPHRRQSTPLGMWAWLWQRISALLIVVFICLHVVYPYKPIIQFLLLLTVTFHGTLGLRVILLDFNLVSVRHHKALAWGLLAAGLIVLFFVWRSIY